jgi:hypothetical protein
MKTISRFPLQSVFAISLLYFIGVMIFIENTSFLSKFNFIAISAFILLITVLLSYGFRSQFSKLRSYLVSLANSPKFSNLSKTMKLLTIYLLGFIPFLINSSLEFVLTDYYTTAGRIAFGFPFPVYSLIAEKFLLGNLFTDSILFAVIIYIVVKAMIMYPELNSK